MTPRTIVSPSVAAVELDVSPARDDLPVVLDARCRKLHLAAIVMDDTGLANEDFIVRTQINRCITRRDRPANSDNAAGNQETALANVNFAPVSMKVS